VRNELGRVLFLQKRYFDAVKNLAKPFHRSRRLQRDYKLDAVLQRLGDDAKANEHKVRYLRFKADESAGYHRPLSTDASGRQQRAAGDSRARQHRAYSCADQESDG